MPIFEVGSEGLRDIKETTFSDVGLKERSDLQRLLRKQIEVVSEDTLVIAEEFGEWEGSRRRIDLLAIDTQANLVVIELKRSEDGGHMELQALRYAAMVSTMTFDRAVEAYSAYLTRQGREDDAAQSILGFLGWDEPDEDDFAQDVRLILVSADFSKELTTSVMWLNERGLDIRCVRIKPYDDNGRTLIDVQQVIPLPEAQDYMISIREKAGKERIDRTGKASRHLLRREFWEGLLGQIEGKTTLFDNVSPSKENWILAGSGISGFHYCFVVRLKDGEISFVLEAEKEKNKAAFDWLHSRRQDIEQSFGEPLVWRRADNLKRSDITFVIPAGGIFTEKSEWPKVQDTMIDALAHLEKAISPHIAGLRNHLQSLGRD
ncbi:MAG: DUF4268 domain-containing protein [candidate division Zixibacteria bacterium]|nr:DUF4268 domain-containing protein [candidate division Zixibacteria bacterium]